MKPPVPTESRAKTALLGVVFFASGVVALLYEAAWQRQFTLLFGSAAPATAAVLAAYFAGLGLGSWLLGKWGARRRRPLRTYAILELVIAAGALLVTPLLSLYATFYPRIYAWGHETAGLFLTVKLLLAFAAIAVPAAAMGGTLPVLAQLFENRRDRLGDLAGRLYMLNTAGAACGVLLFPALLRTLGMRQSVWLCAGVNAILAVAAFLLAKRSGDIAETAVELKRKSPPKGEGSRWWLALAFASGAITFVLQIGWSRIFAQVHENSVYSFSLIVAIFIASIAAGAQLARVMLRARVSPGKALGRAWWTGGVLTFLAVPVFLRMSDGLKYAPGDNGGFAWSLAGPALAVIFIPVVFLSAGLPLIIQQVASASQQPAGEVTGKVLAWNVAGSVAGAMTGGFLLPSTLGLWGTVFLIATLAVVLGSLLLLRGRRKAVFAGILAAGLFPGAVQWFIPRPLVSIDATRNEKISALKEDAYGIAAVVDAPGSRRLKLNNHYGLGGTASTGDERMQAHLPLLLHPRPEKVAFLGYGTGIAAGGAVFHEATQEVTALELVPSVAELAGEFFGDANQHFAKGAKSRVVIEDARNFLRGTSQSFDVIVGDLIVPWRQGEGALYTLENFESARARLAPGGLFCTWLPLYQMGEEDFRIILRTFLEVFPRAAVWRGDFSPFEPPLALIGFAGSAFNPGDVFDRAKTMKPDPLNPQLAHPVTVWMHYIGDVTREQAGDYPLNTEDRPVVELRTRRAAPFVGRKFQAWENEVRSRPLAAEINNRLEAVRGREAGRNMAEFTLLFLERREAEAMEVKKEVVRLLGPEAARSVFGN